jgi:SAM-dependent methyltransferase
MMGRVLDVCCGDAYLPLRAALGERYEGLDIGDSYKYSDDLADQRPAYLSDVEHDPLPFADASFDTVMCISALEHLDNIHAVYDELFRVARQRVIIMLPNNWVGMIGSFLVGHNYTHKAGYGLGPQPKRPGERHKYFFNFEEAATFLLGRMPRGWKLKQVDASFERGTDTWLACRPYYLAAAVTWPMLERRVGTAAAAALMGARLLLYYPVRVAEWLLGVALWGSRGRVVYHNLMCREIWVVFDRKEP